MSANAQDQSLQGQERTCTAPGAKHPTSVVSIVVAMVALLLIAACGDGSDLSGSEDFASFDDTTSTVPDQADDLVDAAAENSGSSTGGTSGSMEIVGEDATCPFISTEAVIEATGITEFAEADFGPNSNTQGEYICSWLTSFTGPAVHMLVRNGGGGWTSEIMDNPNMWGDGAGRDHLIESIGPMGGFLEVWSADKTSSNYVYGDQIYNARGPYTIDDSLNPYADYIIGWYGTNDPNESNDIARALFEATDETFIPQS